MRKWKWIPIVLIAGILLAVGVEEWLDPKTVDGAPASQPLVSFTPGDGPALEILVTGDTGTGTASQRAVARGMAGFAAGQPLDLVLLLGDNFYPSGVESAEDPQWRTAFVEPYSHPALDVPFYPALGNHDYAGNEQAQVGWGGDPRWNLPARYHAFQRELDDGTRVAFVVLDTQPLARQRKTAQEQLAWLDATLAGIRADWILVTGHHPLLSGGMHGNNVVLALQLAPLFARYDVDLYLAGHDHYQAWIPSGLGWVQLVSGAGSSPRDAVWTDETVGAHAGLGFSRVRIEKQRAWVELRAADGTVRSRHVLEKGQGEQ